TPTLAVFLPSGIHSAVVSPDGSKYAILASPRPPDALAEVHEVIEPDQASLYVVNADGTGGAWWCPGLKTIVDSGLAGTPIAWSPDGASIAVLSQTPKIGFHEVRSFIDICGAGGPQRVAEIPNAASGVAWTDAGRQLAFLSTTTSVLTPDHVWTVPVSGGAPTDRTPKLGASATSLIGDARGNVWVLVERGVRRDVSTLHDGQLTTAFGWSDGVVELPIVPQFAGSPARLAFAVGDPRHAENVAIAEGETLRKITSEGDEQLARVDLGPVRVVKWISRDGTALEGIATFPAGYEEGRRIRSWCCRTADPKRATRCT